MDRLKYIILFMKIRVLTTTLKLYIVSLMFCTFVVVVVFDFLSFFIYMYLNRKVNLEVGKIQITKNAFRYRIWLYLVLSYINIVLFSSLQYFFVVGILSGLSFFFANY
jgi:hypothetical protein